MAFARANGWAAIVRFGGIGDNLIAVSPAAQLKKKGLKVEVITSDPAWSVFEHNPHIDKLSVKSKREISTNDMLTWQQWHWGRADEYDVFVNGSHSIENLHAFVPANTPFYYPDAVRRRLANKSYVEFMHDLAGVPYEFGPLFHASKREHERARRTKLSMGPLVIGWCISGTRLDKIYPFSPMVIARLIRELGVAVVMFGGMGRNFEDAKAIMDHVERQNGTHRGLHLALSKSDEDQNWPIRRTLTQALHCDIVIGPDTGVKWGVAFEQIPKICLLGHASAENITKHWINTVTLHADQARVDCYPCHRLHDKPDTCRPNKEGLAAACMSDISAEQILTAAQGLLTRSPRLLLAAE